MEERLQKILARGGLASRRAAEQLVADGRVRVNGKVVTELGSKADPRNDKIEVDGKRVIAEDFVYAVMHKPRGVVSTLADPEGRPTVAEYVGTLGARCYPVGRLDFATSGVLLVTNDGAFADGLLHPKKAVPKTYVVKTNGIMKPEDLKLWEAGVKLEDGQTTGRAHTEFLRHEGDKTWFELTISEGRNQQIRRMGVATGFQVMRLSRVSFAGVTSEGLRPGQIRMLTFDELQSIKASYGVPKRVRSPQALPEAKSREPRPSSRFARTHQPPPQDDRAPVRSKRDDDRPAREERAPARGRSAPRDDRGPARGRPAPRGDAPRTGARPAAPAKKEGRHAPPAGRGRSTPLPSRKPRPESAEAAGGRPAGRTRSAPAGRGRGDAPAGRGRSEAPSGGRGRSGSSEGRSGRGGGPPRGGRSGR